MEKYDLNKYKLQMIMFLSKNNYDDYVNIEYVKNNILFPSKTLERHKKINKILKRNE